MYKRQAKVGVAKRSDAAPNVGHAHGPSLVVQVVEDLVLILVRVPVELACYRTLVSERTNAVEDVSL